MSRKILLSILSMLLILISLNTSVLAQTLPSIMTYQANDIGNDTAMLNGGVINVEIGTIVHVYFEWGISPTFSATTGIQSVNTSSGFAANLGNLIGDTLYVYRAVAIGNFGIIYGESNSFRTNYSLPIGVTSLASDIGAYSVVLNGNLIDKGTASVVQVKFEYGVDSLFTSTTIWQSLNLTGNFSIAIEGLNSNTTYVYRAIVWGHGPEIYCNSITFTTGIITPKLSTLLVTGATHDQVTLNADLVDMGTANSVQTYFEWGQNSLFDNTTNIQSKSISGSFSQILENLTEDTIYNYRSVAIGDGDIVYGESVEFVTAPDPYTFARGGGWLAGAFTISIPINQGDRIVADMSNSGNMQGYIISPMGVVLRSFYTSTTAHIDYLAEIAGNVDFCFVHNWGGIPRYSLVGTIYPCAPPIITTNIATNIGAHSAMFNSELISMGTALNRLNVDILYEYGLDNNYGSSTSLKSVSGVGYYSEAIAGLNADTPYHFRVRAIGDAVVNGEDVVFITLPVILPVVTDINVVPISPYSVTLTGNLTSLGTASAVTVLFDYGLSSNYGTVTESQIFNTTSIFSISIAGLTINTYHFRIRVVGDGEVLGSDMIFTTQIILPSIFISDATSVSKTSVRLNGILSIVGTTSPVIIYFQWGIAPNFSELTSNQLFSSPGIIFVDIDGLTPGTVYIFRIVTIGNDVVYSDSRIFITEVSETIDINVSLQGGVRPNSGWNIPLIVKFFTPNADIINTIPVYVFDITSTKLDSFAVIPCPRVTSGTYDVSISSNHTLLNIKRNLLVVDSLNMINLGTLLEGNANNDDRINIQDFGILSASYGKLDGDPLYNVMTDFDRNGRVNIQDFGLLSANYLKVSPIEVS